MAWTIDPSHSEITFSVRHMMISNVRGRFENFTGTVDFDETNPANTTVDVKIDANSVNTRDEKRDGHLKSPDFFNAAEYPYLVFKSTRLEVVNQDHGRLYGNLTIRDITRPVVVDVEYAGQSKSPWGSYSAGFSASTRISREEWGLTWNVALETGGMLVGDEININIELEIVKQVTPVAETATA